MPFNVKHLPALQTVVGRQLRESTTEHYTLGAIFAMCRPHAQDDTGIRSAREMLLTWMTPLMQQAKALSLSVELHVDQVDIHIKYKSGNVSEYRARSACKLPQTVLGCSVTLGFSAKNRGTPRNFLPRWRMLQRSAARPLSGGMRAVSGYLATQIHNYLNREGACFEDLSESL